MKLSGFIDTFVTRVTTFSRLVMVALSFVTILFAPHAEGQPASAVNMCSKKGDRSLVNECMQSLSPLLEEIPLDTSTEVTFGKWQIKRRQNTKKSQQEDIFLLLDAENELEIEGATVRPALVVRCLDDSTSLHISFESPLSKSPEDNSPFLVSSRTDNNTVVEESWTVSKDRLALFPTGSFISRLRDLAGRQRLRLWLSPSHLKPLFVEFNLRGLKNSLVPLKTACHWK